MVVQNLYLNILSLNKDHLPYGNGTQRCFGYTLKTLHIMNPIKQLICYKLYGKNYLSIKHLHCDTLAEHSFLHCCMRERIAQMCF